MSTRYRFSGGCGIFAGCVAWRAPPPHDDRKGHHYYTRMRRPAKPEWRSDDSQFQLAHEEFHMHYDDRKGHHYYTRVRRSGKPEWRSDDSQFQLAHEEFHMHFQSISNLARVRWG